MSQHAPDGPYVYQPHPVTRKDGKLWHVGGMPDGMTREQATAILSILKDSAVAEAVRQHKQEPLSRSDQPQLAMIAPRLSENEYQQIADHVMRMIAMQFGATTKRDFYAVECALVVVEEILSGVGGAGAKFAP